MDERILLIEDDSRLAEMVRDYLGEAGFHVIHAENGARGLALHAREPVDVVILDLMLPDMDGLDICRQIRARSDSPILMLTARGDAMDRVVGLEMGADDYLPKPFEPRELLGPAARDPAAQPRHGKIERRIEPRRAALRPPRDRPRLRARCASTARPAPSPAINSPCCWRSRSTPAASCRATR